MDFYEVLDEVIALLKERERVSYRALKMQFELSDDGIEALKDELIYAQQVAVDENDRVLVLAGEIGTPTESVSLPSGQPRSQDAIPVPVESSPVQSQVPEAAERRQLTVMFVDLVGSTSLSGTLDPEDLRDIVKAYQAACTGVIQRYDGHVAQLLGDGLLVYFGYPVAHEDDAQRAVRSGLEIVNALGALNTRLQQEQGINLAVRLGIHTGLVVVGEMGGEGRQEQLALGETPNVAARIQGLAEPDTVVISADTHRLIQGYFDCQEVGEQTLRGVSEPIAVYQVLQASGIQSRLDVASIRGLTPLVGREQELGLLFERWAQSREGHGQVILLSGEAGIGKSRLVQALKDHVSDEPHAQEECRCSPYHTNSAFFPLAELLQRKLGWQTEDTADEKLHKLETVLAQTHLDVNTAVPLFTALLSLPLPDDHYPPIQLSPQQQRQKTLEAFLQLVLLAAEQHPVLFIVEDLHWVDPSTLEFLELLITQTPTTAIFVLFTCRPEFQPTWSHRSYFIEVSLNRLSRDDIAQMVARVTGEKPLPNEVIQQLVDKTDGVPLYVEEMTKAVLESGVLKTTNGHYELVGSIASLAIPATLQDSLMSRLDRLVTAKSVAQYASVLGRQFSYELLQAVSQLDEATLQRELGRLVDAELVYQRGLPPQSTYMFKHALIQDTAYESLLRSTRQGYHRRIAEVLEAHFLETVETQPGLLAHHYTEAGLSEQAIGYWQHAGEQAIERSANIEAVAHLNKGLELLLTIPETPEYLQQELDMQVTLGSVLMVTLGSGAPEVKPVYDRAQQLCGKVSQTPQLFPVMMGLCLYYSTCGAYQTAQELGIQLLSLAQHQNDAVRLLSAHTVLGSTYLFTGEFASAYTHLEQALVVADAEVPDERLIDSAVSPRVQCLNYCGVTLWSLGYSDQALQRSLEACHLAQDLGHLPSLSQALSYTANLYLRRREAAAAWERSDSLLTLSREQGFEQYAAFAMGYRGRALAMQGNVEEGIASLHQALADFRHLELTLPQTAFTLLLADAYREAGRIEPGWQTIAKAKALIAEIGHHHSEAELSRLEGELWLAQADTRQAVSEAEKHFLHALNIARSQQAKSLELRAATSLAKLWQSQGRRDEARELLAPVYDWFTEGFDTADLIDTKALLDELSEGL